MREAFTLGDKGVGSERASRGGVASEVMERRRGFLRREKRSPIVNFVLHGMGRQDKIRCPADVSPGTRPAVVFRALDHLRPHGITLYVPKRRDGMRRIQGDAKEPALPQIPSPPFPEVDRARIAAMGFANPLRQPVRGSGRRDQMQMIVHETIPVNPHPKPASLFVQNLQIQEPILGAEIDQLPPISPLGDMVRQIGNDHPSQAAHGFTVEEAL